MKYAILGDIHANVTALEVVLELIDQEGVDLILSVGDVVGYGPSPRECIQVLQSRRVGVVQGNHDAASIGLLDDRYFNNYARAAIRWTRTVLSDADRDWLDSLPMTLEYADCEVAHGSLFRPDLFNYTQTPADADPSLDRMRTAVCFVGHTHVPTVLWRLHSSPSRTQYAFETELDLRASHRSLINVGSVGQPRDEDPRAAYAIYDSAGQTLSIRRAAYDIQREAAMAARVGLPRVLSDRLFLGV